MSSAQDFIEWVNKTPSVFHFATNARNALKDAGYIELEETQEWETIPKKGFVIRDERSLIAFNIGSTDKALIVGTHCDSPHLVLRPNAWKDGKLSVAQYGGGLWVTWFDRDLKLVGRIHYLNEEGNVDQVLFDSGQAVAFLPSPPETEKVNLETHFYPIVTLPDGQTLDQYLSSKSGIDVENILSYDLMLVDAYPSRLIGLNQDLVVSGRLDNLSSTFSALQAFLRSEPTNTMNVLAVFDAEEIGSQTRSGAKSDFLQSVLTEVVKGRINFYELMANSFFVSCDNSHAVHPNFPEKHDKTHRPQCGKGIVIKKSANSAYATDSVTTSEFLEALTKYEVQFFINRNDSPGGTTIGPIVSSSIGVPTIDVGLPQLSMHSIRELMAGKDIEQATQIFVELWSQFPSFII